jgi:hypothetical protein
MAVISSIESCERHTHIAYEPAEEGTRVSVDVLCIASHQSTPPSLKLKLNLSERPYQSPRVGGCVCGLADV